MNCLCKDARPALQMHVLSFWCCANPGQASWSGMHVPELPSMHLYARRFCRIYGAVFDDLCHCMEVGEILLGC